MTKNAFSGKELVADYVRTLPDSQKTESRYFAFDGESLLVIEQKEQDPEDLNYGNALLYRVDFEESGAHTITLLT